MGVSPSVCRLRNAIACLGVERRLVVSWVQLDDHWGLHLRALPAIALWVEGDQNYLVLAYVLDNLLVSASLIRLWATDHFIIVCWGESNNLSEEFGVSIKHLLRSQSACLDALWGHMRR